MISVKTKMGKTEVNISGSVAMLCTDTVQIVRVIYDAIRDRSEEAGEAFKKMMTDSLCKMAFMNDDEVHSEVIKSIKELIELIGGADND